MSSDKIKPITEEESLDILFGMKSNVIDINSISPNHYRNAGPIGWYHFHLLLSACIDDVVILIR